MFFADILGHERPIHILKRALANKTIAHAYIFSGEAGIGKKTTALALAAAINCSQAGESGGCGACPSCRKITAGGHPDVHLVTSGGEEIKIDQIRDMQADLGLKPFEGQKKILIVDGAENMNTASANAFLKTLEEPPGDALIILITAMPQSLLPTIRSRCQEIRFLPLSRQSLAKALMDRRGITEEDAWFLAALAQGSLGRGLEMDIDREKTERGEFLSLWAGLKQMSPGELRAQAEALSKDKERLERFLEIGIEQLRDTLVWRATGDDKLLVYGQEREVQSDIPQDMSVARMLSDVELFTESRRLLDRRVSTQLVAENFLMKLGKG